ncbi:DUF2934 domain-containing protein [Bradyrhizobium vignae]|uniref:DUF2934 domain-containing protein n=1 Tax=Bradyrhizobium vignae TaxID=1549949 RepID=A0ABS3ZXA0_9BRAD|nr:DUF2934 domain-containing protein [Bradyrhizobium vignae]MBP0112761.1 DUF2934 domain-containing protein [Bradyrhizobium vignae]
MSQVDLEDVRARAYKLWEEAGRPEGRIDEFWFEAEQRLKEESLSRDPKRPDNP